jgi:NAD+ kinase
MREGFERALAGTLDVLSLPAIEVEGPAGSHVALNDLSLHRKVGGRVAELAYAIAGEEIGSVRCDGLVVATPAGSTGYNLANGGPVMAWGVAGMAVSFIAPHSLSARALVVAPDDVLMLHNSSRETLAVSVDGRPVGEIAPAEVVRARFAHDVATLGQMDGSSFYRRLREKFGRLSR